MSGFLGINLRDILSDNKLGESAAKSVLSSFSCPLNSDIEHFLHHTAIEFSKQNISSTYLVMASYKNNYVLVGYFTLANKIFCISKSSLPSQIWRKRLTKFSKFNKTIQCYTLSAPLIGQLSKNFTNGYNELIAGNELLKLALDKIRQMQYIVGGKIVYLECEQKEKLIEFYTQNGFVNFGTRMLEQDETATLSGNSLVQMLKYL